MEPLGILAQAVESAETSASDSMLVLNLFWDHVVDLGPIEAATFISFGTVCLLYGWRVFKILVVICFALLGLALGMTLGEKIQGDNSELWAGLAGLGLMGAVSLPLMRYAVSILGAIAGGILTSGLWYACGLTDTYIWAGALIGIIAGGMISFIVFRIAVMLFSSLGGSSLIVVGLLALLYTYHPGGGNLKALVLGSKWFLPTALMVPTAIGLIVQNKFIKGAKEWRV